MNDNHINWLGNRVVNPNMQTTPYSESLPEPSPVEMVISDRPGEIVPPDTRQGPPPVMDEMYIPGYLTSLIGKNVRAEFLINSMYMDKAGVLKEVGVNYFVLEDIVTRARIMCDLYSVRFVTTL